MEIVIHSPFSVVVQHYASRRSITCQFKKWPRKRIVNFDGVRNLHSGHEHNQKRSGSENANSTCTCLCSCCGRRHYCHVYVIVKTKQKVVDLTIFNGKF